MDVTTDQNFLVPIGCRHRVFIVAVAHERQGVDATWALVTGIVGRRQGLLKDGEVTLQSFPDRTLMPPQPVCLPLPAARQQIRVQRIKTVEYWNRHKEVAPRITHKPFDFAFLVTLAWAANAVSKQLM